MRLASTAKKEAQVMKNQDRGSVAAEADTLLEEAATELVARNRRAAELLDRWLEEDDAYDRETWPFMEQELDGLRTRIGD